MSKSITAKDVAAIFTLIIFLIYGFFKILKFLIEGIKTIYLFFKNKQSSNYFEKKEESILPSEILISSKLRITYVDSNGIETHRKIEVHNVRYSNNLCYLDAYCHLRNAPKTFRTDRILDMVNLATGEFVSPKYFLEGTITQDIN